MCSDQADERNPVKLTFRGCDSKVGDCPTLYATDRGTIVVQGWRLTDAEALATMDIPDHETAVEIPAALLRHAPRLEGRSGAYA